MKHFLFLCLIFTLAGCSLYEVQSQEADTQFYPTKESAIQVVYLETVDRPCEIIGHATVNAERNQKLERVIEKLKQEAAYIGGDAITNITTDTGTGQWAKNKPKALFGNSNIRINYNADVLVFKEITHQEQTEKKSQELILK